MGFLEREEQKSRERNKKLQEDREKERRTHQEDQDRLRFQKTLAMENKKRLYRLRREAKIQFIASGLKAMLDRLIKAGAIQTELSDSVVTEDREPLLPERAWEEMTIKDGSFHTKVIVSDESRDTIGLKYVNTKRFFNITTDSTGLITFEYGRFFRKKRTIAQFEWKGNPDVLEEVLEKAYKSPFHEVNRWEHYIPSPPYSGFG